jgi:hypothetical protein
LIEDIEKNCKNKRLKKNIYKMDLLLAKNNNGKLGLDAPIFSLASSDYLRIPRLANDPIISR